MLRISANWCEESSHTDTIAILSELALRHASLGGTHGQAIGTLIANGRYKDLCEYDLPLSQPDWDTTQLFHARQAQAMLKKQPDLVPEVDKKRKAVDGFDRSERMCKATNDLFRAFSSHSVMLRARDVRVLHAARRKIKVALGRCPELRDLPLRLGPGATTTIRKIDANPQNKFADGLHCSTDLLASGLLPELLRQLPHVLEEYAHESGILVDDQVVGETSYYTYDTVNVHLWNGKLQFVPKNALNYRSIVVEPLLSGMLQMGIGDFMVDRLLGVGLYIREDSTKHRNLAHRASVTGSLATLDLSSASDTIAYLLVKFLLPARWFQLLCAARSGTVDYKKQSIVLEKFSSMGNGFTFPLETLIFWALSCASLIGSDQETDVSCFGDDIIVPTGSVTSVIRTLELCGFELNRSKSFVEGPFRESCGGDYYNGVDVKPHSFKKLASGVSLFTLHNFYIRRGLDDFARLVREYIPEPLLLYGPDGYGDGHLLGDFERRIRKAQRLNGYCGYLFDTFRLGAKKTTSIYPGDHITPLYSVYRKAHTELKPPIGFFNFPEETTVQRFTKNGRPIWDLPGTEGYTRTSIYTLH